MSVEESIRSRAIAPGILRHARRLLTGHSMLAMLERLVRRGASSFVTFLVALIVSPETAGIYAFGALVLSLSQALGESALRQVGVASWNYEGGAAQLRRISNATAWLGSGIVAAALLVGYLTHLYDITGLLILTPFVVVSWLQGRFAPNITLAQYHSRWPQLARLQLIGGVISMAVAIPLLFNVGILAAVLQTVLAEGIFLIGCARMRMDEPVATKPPTRTFKLFVWPTIVSNMFGWISGQSSRLMVTIFAGTERLGILSIALAISISVTDAALNGIVNLLRSRLSAAADQAARLQVLSKMTLQAVLLSVVLQAFVTYLSIFPLRAILAQEWHPALAIVALLAMSGAPMAFHYMIAGFVIDSGEAKRLRTINFFALGSALATGAVFALALPAGAIAKYAADLASVLVMLPLVKGAYTGRTRLALLGLMIISFAIGMAAFWLL
jgi:O-antigen/teichoic acid export membrane protein